MVKSMEFRRLENMTIEGKNTLLQYMDTSRSTIEELARLDNKEQQLTFFRDRVILPEHSNLQFLAEDPEYIPIAEELIKQLTEEIRIEEVPVAAARMKPSRPRKKLVRKEKPSGVRIVTITPKKGKPFTRTHTKWSDKEIKFAKKNKNVRSSKEIHGRYKKQFPKGNKTQRAVYLRAWRERKKT